MRRPIIITPGLPLKRFARRHRAGGRRARKDMRSTLVAMTVLLMSTAIAAQLVHLALAGQSLQHVAISNPIATSLARPDIVDRQGRLLATDVSMPSLFADPSRVRDRDAVVEKLSPLLPGLDRRALRTSLSDPDRRFDWVRRGVSPAIAQQIHNLGLPGLAFRNELKRAYPGGGSAGHVLGTVDVDNKGLSGIEGHIDEIEGADPVVGTEFTGKPPLQLSIDLGVQFALDDELRLALKRYKAKAAAGVVMDVETGEVVAATSLPGVNPMRSSEFADAARRDRLMGGSYELGSIFKMFTVAMALEAGLVSPDTILDVTKPLIDGRHRVEDLHGAGRPLSVAEIFTHSSNVGSGLLALASGPERQRLFLDNFRLLDQIETEAGPVAAPQVPETWQRIHQITIAFGHGIAVAPLQFAASAAALVNGGLYVPPTFLHRGSRTPTAVQRVLSEATSRKMRQLMRLNVTDPAGTGNRAAAAGYRVGGKTGTAEIPGRGGYREKDVIASFVAAFPMDKPRFITLVTLFKPKATEKSGGKITASRNAAPTTGRLIRRIAPLLNVAPDKQRVSLN